MAPVSRAAHGRFAKGNPGGSGGKRRRSGRKPDRLKRLVEDAFEPHIPAAFMALGHVLKTGAPAERLRAAELVFAYVKGKPVQRVDARLDSGNAMDLLDRADHADLAAVAAMGTSGGQGAADGQAKVGARRRGPAA